MKCINVPKYLHYSDNRKKYSSKCFRFYHLLYRTGFKERENPIEFPQVISAFSVCWSKLIIPSDVLSTVRLLAKNPEKMGDTTYFGKVKKIKKIKIEKIYNAVGVFSGQHILTTEAIHSPLECNYSHSEILIKHIYPFNGKEKIDIISYDDWKEKKCLLRQNAHKDFFQPMINEYKAKIATALNSNINELKAKWYYKFLPKNIVVSFNIWKMIFLKNPEK